MSNSKSITINGYQIEVANDHEKYRILKLRNRILSDVLSKCVRCGVPLGVCQDNTIRCINLSCSEFMVIGSSDQMYFDF